jgi:hypothetical protein
MADNIVDEVEIVHGNALSTKSKRNYRGGIRGLLAWLFVNRREALTAGFLAEVGDGPVKKQHVEKLLAAPVASDRFPLSEKFTIADFEKYLTTLRTPAGELPEHSTLHGRRAAFTHLYSAFARDVPAEYRRSLKEYLRGSRRMAALRKANGDGKIASGKEKFTFTLYSMICEELVKGSEGGDSMDFILAHAFITLSWNLMCRAGT